MSPKRCLFAACAGRFFCLARAKMSVARRAISIIFIDTSKVIIFHCGSRMFRKKFSAIVLQCCSVAVLGKLFPKPQNTSIFIYKYRVKIGSSYSLFLNCNTATTATASAEPRLCRAQQFVDEDNNCNKGGNETRPP